jgi:hypothetical protein
VRCGWAGDGEYPVAAIIGGWLPWCVIRDGSSMTVEPVCAAFGLAARPGASITALSRGAAGRIWHLDLGADRYAVKELFVGSDEESVCREVAFTAHLQAAGTG